MKIIIYVMRHGLRNMIYHHNGVELNQRGLEQANNQILNTLLNIQINEVWCSIYTRAIQTVFPYLKETGKMFNTDDCLHEYIPMILCIFDEYHPANKVLSPYNLFHNESYLIKGGIKVPENRDNVRKRVINFVKKHGKRLNNSLIVSHNTVVCEFLRLSTGDECNKGVMMGKVYKLIIEI